MPDSSHKARMEKALAEASPFGPLRDLAVSLKVEGMSQRELHDLFNYYRDQYQRDSAETKYDAILDVMDPIVGWGTHSDRLFENDLQP